jgi:gas vesicle protein
MNHFLTGLAVGYLATPRSGKQTREQLKTTADEKIKGVKDQSNKTVPQVKDLVETLKSQVGMGQSTPNLFTNMKSGRVDNHKLDANNQQQAVQADDNQ